MKKFVFCIAILLLAACSRTENGNVVKFDVSSPSPTEQITKVGLNDTQKGYVEAGNAMAFKFLKEIYEGENVICSPLSLQYALAMAANGASGETLQEIIDFLGYGADGIDALNEYSKILLEQLPAVDLDVTLKVTDALIVNKLYPLLPSFKKTVEDYYYAAVENMDFSDPGLIARSINDWASRNTNGFIDKVIQADEISDNAVAFLMNALYFKAMWMGSEYEPLFDERNTSEEKFTLADGSAKQVPTMHSTRYFDYAEMEGFKVVALPYAGGKYFMYILLPDENNVEGLLEKVQDLSMEELQGKFMQDVEVVLSLPKFDIENKFDLKETLQTLGIKRAFNSVDAQLDRMFVQKESNLGFYISKVIQKSRIAIDEWGTEAAAVTIVEVCEKAIGPIDEHKTVYFTADHPFIFAIGESTSGTILFEGVYSGK